MCVSYGWLLTLLAFISLSPATNSDYRQLPVNCLLYWPPLVKCFVISGWWKFFLIGSHLPTLQKPKPDMNKADVFCIDVRILDSNAPFLVKKNIFWDKIKLRPAWIAVISRLNMANVCWFFQSRAWHNLWNQNSGYCLNVSEHKPPCHSIFLTTVQFFLKYQNQGCQTIRY